MTKRTDTASDKTTKWGLFRTDAVTFDNTTVFQGNWYETENDAKKAMDNLKSELPYFLKLVPIIKEVKIDPADQKKTHQFVAMS